MKQSINVFLPMRAGSERVPNKNTKTFSGVEGGLCRIKIEQLIKCNHIDTILVSTNDPEVVRITNLFNSKKIRIAIRPDELASSSASTDDLIKHVPEVMPDGHILWTHVTSPFISSSNYSQVIEKYLDNLRHFDSLMTVTKVQKFIWNESEPVNYNRNLEKWPKTQTIEPLWEVNSGVFLAHKSIYEDNKDRIGDTPYLFQLSDEVAFDIDWMPDYKIAESLYFSMHGIPKVSDNGKKSRSNINYSKQHKQRETMIP